MTTTSTEAIKPKRRKRWTPEDDTKLIQLHANSSTMPEMVKALGRTADGIRKRLRSTHDLEPPGVESGGRRMGWKPWEHKTFARLYFHDNKTAEQIKSEMPARSLGSIKTKISEVRQAMAVFTAMGARVEWESGSSLTAAAQVLRGVKRLEITEGCAIRPDIDLERNEVVIRPAN